MPCPPPTPLMAFETEFLLIRFLFLEFPLKSRSLLGIPRSSIGSMKNIRL